MSIQIRFQDKEPLGRKFSFGVKKFADATAKASQATAYRVAAEIEHRGRTNIRRAGNFGSARWQEGLRAFVSYKSRWDLNIRVAHAVPYWTVFEFGAVIKGNPLLWIPLSFAADAQGVMARDHPDVLFRVDRKNGKAPLLMNTIGEAKYFGKESVTIPKKFNIRGITEMVSKKMPDYYKQELKRGRRRR